MVQFSEVITFYVLSTDKRNEEELYSNVERKSSVCLHTNSIQQVT